MSDRNDLTRWNRASLKRFRYIDGNAVEYLEIIRQRLVKHFVDANNPNSNWLEPAVQIPEYEEQQSNETLSQRQERLSRKQERILTQYHQERRDWAWEISRAFVRACHILTEHANAYANENYLNTATEWEHVRRMVEMIDYHPAPPASAYTRLVFTAKDNKKGTIAKGFKVQYVPETGGQKIVYETLSDFDIDSELNALRPKGWDDTDDPAVSLPDDNDTDDKYSNLANNDSIVLQGIGEIWFEQLNTIPNKNPFKIYHFLSLDPKNPGFVFPVGDNSTPINTTRLHELKARATEICFYDPGNGWTEIYDMFLPDIVAMPSDLLSEQTKKPVDDVLKLQQKMELFGSYLDNDIYMATTLRDLRLPPNTPSYTGEPPSAVTAWKAKQKPKVVEGDVAMILWESEDLAEGATVSKVDQETNYISLLMNQVGYTWHEWPKKEIELHVSPRWKRDCWLNNESDVIRTIEPHGFTKDAYISWEEKDQNNVPFWRYAKVIEADKQTMRLEQDGNLPQSGTKIFAALSFDGDQMPAKFEEIVLINDKGADKAPNVVPVEPKLDEPEPPENIPEPVFEIKKIFTLDTFLNDPEGGGGGGGGGGLLPPASLPKIGSFLFPSPMLPMDLVKVAVDLLLSLGVMQIPSTGEIVIKGMPFGDILGGLDDLSEAAKLMVTMLDDMTMQVQGSGGFLYEAVDKVADVPDPDEEGETKLGLVLPSPIYFELTCKDQAELNQIIQNIDNLSVVRKDGTSLKFTDIDPDQPGTGTLECDNGKVVYKLGDDKYPLGYHATYSNTAFNNQKFKLNLTDWNLTSVPGDPNPLPANPTEEQIQSKKEEYMQVLLQDASKDASVLYKMIVKDYPVEPEDPKNPGATETISGPLLAVPGIEHRIAKAVVQESVPIYMFDGKPDALENSDWVVGRFDDGLRGLKIQDILDQSDEEAEKFSVSFSNLNGDEGELKKVYADFRGALIAEGLNVNTSVIDSSELELDEIPDGLKTGNEVMFMADGKDPVVARIEVIDTEKNIIITNPSAEGFSKGELKIFANVVLAGHGESKPAKILGSGDAARVNQEFILEVRDISFPPDSTKPSGVAAAIDVEVAGRIWEQVSTLKNSGPGDHHYAIRMTEDGYVKILFGDGEYGRRLPTGKNNVRIRYRVGTGLSGNVDPGSLEKPVNPHPYIKSIQQPIRASGGGDMEDIVSLRENAPSTVLALNRAVSLSDYVHLAASQSSVWQANAYNVNLNENRLEIVEVVIVPAGGSDTKDTRNEVELFLQEHSLPGVQVKVINYNDNQVDLTVKVRIKTDEFIADEVISGVKLALVDHFKLQNRKLGEHLYLSEVYKVVEGVKGVENSVCTLNSNESLKLVRADDKSWVVFLDTDDESTLIVTHERYEP